ncbi:MAG: hypothetical protein PHE21_03535, partial [Candidatus Dojkabacteria bacterium]|nr:hypothetical protein [Candidatus Dojkabacteria bacterium]
ENSNDFEPTIGGNVDSKMYDLLTLRETKLKEIEDNNCYVQMNANDLCDKIRKELRAINEDISRQVSFRASESRYCGMKDDDEFISTCQEALDWNYHYGDRDCKSCNDIIQKLLTISSSMSNESLSADLLTLTSVLEKYNELVLARVKAMRESYANDIPMAFNRDRIRLVESLSNAELQREYAKEEYKIEKSLLFGKPLTKENLVEHYYSIMDSLLGSINETEEMIDNYSSTIEELEKEITSYTSVVNGAYQLNLSSPK